MKRDCDNQCVVAFACLFPPMRLGFTRHWSDCLLATWRTNYSSDLSENKNCSTECVFGKGSPIKFWKSSALRIPGLRIRTGSALLLLHLAYIYVEAHWLSY